MMAPNEAVRKVVAVFMAGWISAVTKILPFVRLKIQVKITVTNRIKTHSTSVSERVLASIPPNLPGACQTAQRTPRIRLETRGLNFA